MGYLMEKLRYAIASFFGDGEIFRAFLYIERSAVILLFEMLLRGRVGFGDAGEHVDHVADAVAVAIA